MAPALSSFQENLKRIDHLYSTLNDDELVKLQTEIAAAARNTENIRKSVEEIKELGQMASSTDSAFVTVSRAFDRFVQENEGRFPETRQFLDRWTGYHDVHTNPIFMIFHFCADLSAS